MFMLAILWYVLRYVASVSKSRFFIEVKVWAEIILIQKIQKKVIIQELICYAIFKSKPKSNYCKGKKYTNAIF